MLMRYICGPVVRSIWIPPFFWDDWGMLDQKIVKEKDLYYQKLWTFFSCHHYGFILTNKISYHLMIIMRAINIHVPILTGGLSWQKKHLSQVSPGRMVHILPSFYSRKGMKFMVLSGDHRHSIPAVLTRSMLTLMTRMPVCFFIMATFPIRNRSQISCTIFSQMKCITSAPRVMFGSVSRHRNTRAMSQRSGRHVF